MWDNTPLRNVEYVTLAIEPRFRVYDINPSSISQSRKRGPTKVTFRKVYYPFSRHATSTCPSFLGGSSLICSRLHFDILFTLALFSFLFFRYFAKNQNDVARKVLSESHHPIYW